MPVTDRFTCLESVCRVWHGYPKPIVEHEFARGEVFGEVQNGYLAGYDMIG